MQSVFEILSRDHLEVKRMLAELETGPTVATGASATHLGLRKKMVEELIIEESKHEAAEEMYFWPAVREHLPNGDQLAETATSQEQEAKKVLNRLDKLNADRTDPPATARAVPTRLLRPAPGRAAVPGTTNRPERATLAGVASSARQRRPAGCVYAGGRG